MAIQVKTLNDTNSPAAGTPFTGIDNGQFIEYGFFYLVFSGSYTTGGDAMSFVGVTDLLKSGYAPITAQAYSQNPSGSGHSGFQYYYRPGGVSPFSNPAATLANGKLQVLQPGSANSPMVEIGQGTYASQAAGVLTDFVVCQAAFVRI